MFRLRPVSVVMFLRRFMAVNSMGILVLLGVVEILNCTPWSFIC